MKLSAGLRLILSALLLAVSVGVVWWVLGYPLGKGLLQGTGGEAFFRRQYAFDESTAIRLAFVALVVTFTASAVPAVATRWLALGAIAGVAALLEPERGAPYALATILLVFSVPGVGEITAPVKQLVAGLVAGVVVVLPSAVDAHLGVGPTAALAALRGILYVAPLLLFPGYLERWVLKRLGV